MHRSGGGGCRRRNSRTEILGQEPARRRPAARRAQQLEHGEPGGVTKEIKSDRGSSGRRRERRVRCYPGGTRKAAKGYIWLQCRKDPLAQCKEKKLEGTRAERDASRRPRRYCWEETMGVSGTWAAHGAGDPGLPLTERRETAPGAGLQRSRQLRAH